jgi:hypothetical protein
MSDGAGTALLIIGVGVGGYALYRFMKRGRSGGHLTGHYFAGAPPECGPTSYWDADKQSCVPLSLPSGGSGQGPQCPPGTFYDYFRQSCVASAPPPPHVGWDY